MKTQSGYIRCLCRKCGLHFLSATHQIICPECYQEPAPPIETRDRREYYQAHKEHLKAKGREYYRRNRERMKAYRRKYYRAQKADRAGEPCAH